MVVVAMARSRGPMLIRSLEWVPGQRGPAFCGAFGATPYEPKTLAELERIRGLFEDPASGAEKNI